MTALFSLCVRVSDRVTYSLFFFFYDAATPAIYSLSLHDALPISLKILSLAGGLTRTAKSDKAVIVRKDDQGQQHEVPIDLKKVRSEEHTSELQSRRDLVCRLLLEKKKQKYPEATGTIDAVIRPSH